MPPLEVGDYVCTDTCLGRGTNGTVYQGYHKKTREPVAIKVVSLNMDRLHFKYLLQEREILKKLDHPNIVKLYQEYEVGQQLYLIMELMLGGELYNLIYRKKGLAEPIARKFMCQLVSGLKYLNDRGIVHRDLKPHNLLLTSACETSSTLKIADFGFARFTSSLMQTRLGSPLYMAPELLLMSGPATYSSKSDMWSVGVIFWEMLTGRRPWAEAGDSEATLHQLVNKQRLALPNNISQAAKSLLRRLLEKDPAKRISCEELCFCEYVQPAKVAASIIDNNETWLQEVISFERGASQSLYVTPDFSISEFKERISKMWPNASNKPLLLLDPMGSELKENLTFRHYDLHLRPKPLYCVERESLYGNPEVDSRMYAIHQIKVDKLETFEDPQLSPSTRAKMTYKFLREYSSKLALYADAVRKELATVYALTISSCALQQKAWKVVCSYIYSRRNDCLNLWKEEIEGEIRRTQRKAQDLKERLSSTLVSIKQIDFAELYAHPRQPRHLFDMVDYDEIQRDSRRIKSDVEYLEEQEQTAYRLQSRQLLIEQNLDPVLSQLPISRLQKCTKVLHQAKYGLENCRREFYSKWANEKVQEWIASRFQHSLEHDLPDSNQVWDCLNACEQSLQKFLEQVKSARLAMKDCIELKRQIDSRYFHALISTQPYRSEIDAFHSSWEAEIKPRLLGLHQTIQSLSRLLVLPKNYENAVSETKRRCQWSKKIDEQIKALNRHFDRALKLEIQEREIFSRSIDPYASRIFEPIFPWLFSTSPFAKFYIDFQCLESLPSSTSNSDQEVVVSPDATQQQQQPIPPHISEQDYQSLVDRYLALSSSFLSLKDSENTLRRELDALRDQLKHKPWEKEIQTLKQNISLLEGQKHFEDFKRENLELKLQLEQLSKLKTVNAKLREDLQGAENLVNQLLQDRPSKS
ncbi:rho-associated protein kinase let-502-like [Schistocerca gregaria]|uniref:rho-associated protein kinase let-502-like n=1 Tax=Schistocerca gregaria TaxID=7010 RepID=UPI00211DB0D6|nr:rho-associated protein kinase let-502-like [Schistocerca gregaria]